MKLFLQVDVSFDVVYRIRRKSDGRILDEYRSNNVVVNSGRKFVRDSLASSGYPQSSLELPDPAIGDTPVSDGKIVPLTEHRPMYVAVGTGGVLQDRSYPGPGTYPEVITTMGLERPIPVRINLEGLKANPDPLGQPFTHLWCKQVLPQIPGSSELPDNYTVVYRALFDGAEELSFAGQIGSYGTMIPVSEALLLSSAFHPYQKAPHPHAVYTVTKSDGSTEEYAGYEDGEVPGAIAYNVCAPRLVLPDTTFEILWYVRL